jgi:hypothetical protein
LSKAKAFRKWKIILKTHSTCSSKESMNPENVEEQKEIRTGRRQKRNSNRRKKSIAKNAKR